MRFAKVTALVQAHQYAQFHPSALVPGASRFPLWPPPRELSSRKNAWNFGPANQTPPFFPGALNECEASSAYFTQPALIPVCPTKKNSTFRLRPVPMHLDTARRSASATRHINPQTPRANRTPPSPSSTASTHLHSNKSCGPSGSTRTRYSRAASAPTPYAPDRTQ